MKARFKDIIEIIITLDSDNMKSICDAIAEVNPNSQMDKNDFFNMAMEEIIRNYFGGYIWYYDSMPVYEIEEMCPNIVEKIIEYVDWYIIHYYLAKQEEFKWSK